MKKKLYFYHTPVVLLLLLVVVVVLLLLLLLLLMFAFILALVFGAPPAEKKLRMDMVSAQLQLQTPVPFPSRLLPRQGVAWPASSPLLVPRRVGGLSFRLSAGHSRCGGGVE